MYDRDWSFAVLVALLCARVLGSSGTTALSGQMNLISQNFGLETFFLNRHSFSRLFGVQLEGGTTHLRPPCPACPSTYNVYTHRDEIIIPAAQRFFFFRFTRSEPYVASQSILAEGCDPLSITSFSASSRQLYIVCRDTEIVGKAFLALLTQSFEDETSFRWSFSRIHGYENLYLVGTFVEVFALNSPILLYVHEAAGYLELNGIESGFIVSLAMPENCGHFLRLTPIRGGKVLIECSSLSPHPSPTPSPSSETATNLHLFDITASSMNNLTSLPPYLPTSCPLRQTEDGAVVALLCPHTVTVVNVSSGAHTSFSISFDLGAIYDGLIFSRDGGAVYVVTSTPNGLHRTSIPKVAPGNGEGTLPLTFNGSTSICSRGNCSLLMRLDSGTILASLDHYIGLFSVSTLQLVAKTATTYQPARIIFQPIEKQTTPTTTASPTSSPDPLTSVAIGNLSPSPSNRYPEHRSPTSSPPHVPPSSSSSSPPPPSSLSRSPLSLSSSAVAINIITYNMDNTHATSPGIVVGVTMAIGIVVCVVGVVLFATTIYCLKKKKKRKIAFSPSVRFSDLAEKHSPPLLPRIGGGGGGANENGEMEVHQNGSLGLRLTPPRRVSGGVGCSLMQGGRELPMETWREGSTQPLLSQDQEEERKGTEREEEETEREEEEREEEETEREEEKREKDKEESRRDKEEGERRNTDVGFSSMLRPCTLGVSPMHHASSLTTLVPSPPATSALPSHVTTFDPSLSHPDTSTCVAPVQVSTSEDQSTLHVIIGLENEPTQGQQRSPPDGV